MLNNVFNGAYKIVLGLNHRCSNCPIPLIHVDCFEQMHSSSCHAVVDPEGGATGARPL